MCRRSEERTVSRREGWDRARVQERTETGHMAKDKHQAGGAQELRSHEGGRAWSRIRRIQPGIPAVPLGAKGPCDSSLSDLGVFLVCHLRIMLATASLIASTE